MVFPKATSNNLSSRWEAITATRVGRLSLLTLMVLAIVPYLFSMGLHDGSSNNLLSLIGKDAYERTPMCDTSGECGESPDIPSPRTIYSAKSKHQYELWWKAHAQLNQSASEYVERRYGKQNQGKQSVIFLGDSITEEWLGTNMGQPEERWKDVPEVLRENFLGKFDPLVLAIGGDQTQHLLWRLQHGEILPLVANDESATFVVLIGTNNIGSGSLPEPTSRGVTAVAEYILQNTKGRLLLLRLLPRGDSFRLERLCPPRCDVSGKPFQSFMPAINKVNKAIQEAVLDQMKGFEKRIKLIDCGPDFVPLDGFDEVIEDLMPDKLHPNSNGHRMLAKCILQGMDQF